MISFYLYFPGSVLIQVKSSGDLGLSELLLGAYVPGAELVANPDRTPDMVIEHEQTDDKRLIRKEDRIHIYDNWEKDFPLDFYHLLYSMVRVELLKRGFFSVHAACIGKSDYVLIVGHTGVGKTSVVLELLKNKAMKLFSGNKTIVAFKGGALEAVGGTSTLTASVEDINKHHSGNNTDVIKYGTRAAVTPNKHMNNPGRIRAIVLVGLNDGVAENNLLDPVSALHRLYAYFLDTINADTIVCGGRDVYVGTPPTGVQESLAQNLKEVLSKIPTYSIKGSMDFVCDAITKL